MKMGKTTIRANLQFQQTAAPPPFFLPFFFLFLRWFTFDALAGQLSAREVMND